MRSSLSNRQILVGICGSVAAYKSIDLIRRIKEDGASVDVIMTDASCRFISPLLVESATGCKVYQGTFDDPLSHVELASKAHLMLIAPATANIIGKLAGGIADDLLSTAHLAFKGPLVLAPAMNWRMYEHPCMKQNMQTLISRGAIEVAPEHGALACGEQGKGRMASTDAIIETARRALATQDLAGWKVVVTAGPTREPLDAVRYITNRSSGKMGYALARAARRRGADVTLISGPSSLPVPTDMKFIKVERAAQMLQAVVDNLPGATALFMAAAVADFSPHEAPNTKLPKESITTLELERTPDILAHVGHMQDRPLLVGFAAEAGPNIERARQKLLTKGADMVVFNDITERDAGFEVDTNRIVIVERTGQSEYPLMAKDEASDVVLDKALQIRA